MTVKQKVFQKIIFQQISLYFYNELLNKFKKFQKIFHYILFEKINYFTVVVRRWARVKRSPGAIVPASIGLILTILCFTTVINE